MSNEDAMTTGTVTTGNIMKGYKVQYGACVKPKYKKYRLTEEAYDKIGAYKDSVELEEDTIVYDSYNKTATLYHLTEEVASVRCTSSEWNMFTDSVVDSLLDRRLCNE